MLHFPPACRHPLPVNGRRRIASTTARFRLHSRSPLLPSARPPSPSPPKADPTRPRAASAEPDPGRAGAGHGGNRPRLTISPRPEDFEPLAEAALPPPRSGRNRDAFSQFSANITFEEQATFKLGNALFRKNWVSAPSSTQASDGLGPLFNARACQSCHLKDGRGHPPGANRTPPRCSCAWRVRRQTQDEERASRRPDGAQLPRPGLWRAAPGPRRSRACGRGPHGGSPMRNSR